MGIYASRVRMSVYTRRPSLPSLCKEVSSFQARNIWIAPIVDEGKTLDSIQWRVVTAEGVPLYFKPRVEMREPEFERELCTLWCIYKAGLANRFRVPRLHSIVVSGETTIGCHCKGVTCPRYRVGRRSSYECCYWWRNECLGYWFWWYEQCRVCGRRQTREYGELLAGYKNVPGMVAKSAETESVVMLLWQWDKDVPCATWWRNGFFF